MVGAHGLHADEAEAYLFRMELAQWLFHQTALTKTKMRTLESLSFQHVRRTMAFIGCTECMF